MKNRILLFVMVISLGISGSLLSGCSSDYLDTAPSTSVSEALIGKSIDNLYMAINGIHRKMVSQDMAVQYLGGYPGFMICMETSADDMTWAQDKEFKTTHQWQLQSLPESKFTRTIWLSYYEFILNTNLILKYVDNFMDSAPQKARQVKGEALCFRAFSHFMLVQTYGQRYRAGMENSQPGVPYRLESGTQKMARNSVEECYRLIIRDLDEAIGLLAGYVPESVSHFSQEVAYGLRARVALARQDYATAAQNAALAIAAAEARGFKLMEGEELYNGFADISDKTKEVLWAALTLNDQTVNYYSFYALMSWNYNSEPVRTGVKQISSTLYQQIAPTDLRRGWWDETGTLPLPTANFKAYPYSQRKFTARSTGDVVGNVAFMRLAELYLMQAEALARSGDDVSAQEVLTRFAMTRDPAYEPKNNHGEALINEIMIQRRIELWGEGFRFYDLKRLNEPLDRTGSNFNAGFCMILQAPASDPRWQWAIPQDEMDANPLMEQNKY
ncbi:MAG: RagB/SusD family nutrient uptake outer membrane protein [Bacteroidales bacterium]